MPRQTYTAGEAARRLGISIDTLRRWDRQGRIRTRRDHANRRVVLASEVERLRGGSLHHDLSARNRLLGTVREVKIEEECLKILALHQPVAVDLRRTATVLKINTELERIADLAG